MEHVRVREHEVRPAADLAPPLGRRVSVVDRGADGRQAELAERARLILGERLGRVEVERARVPVGGERVEHRQVEGERLAGGRAGRDDHVAAALRGRVRLGLVRVELVDPAPAERFPERRLEGVRQRRGPRLAARLGREVRELVARRGGRPRRRRWWSLHHSSGLRLAEQRQLHAVRCTEANVAAAPRRNDRIRHLSAPAATSRLAVPSRSSTRSASAHGARDAPAGLDPIDALGLPLVEELEGCADRLRAGSTRPSSPSSSRRVCSRPSVSR